MHRSQADRAVIAARAALNPVQRPAGRPGTDLLARHEASAIASGHGRIHRTRVTVKGQAGPWSRPMHLRPFTAPMMPAWDKTVSR